MTASFLILFRETLEIAIILGIILAATQGIAGRARWIVLGMLGGILGSAAVAVFAERISMAMEGMGQEVFNAAILGVAVLMIGWTVIWMQSHGRALSQKIRKIGQSVSDGELPLYAITVVIALSMWREGSEIVLFMTGILSTSQDTVAAIVTGAAAGAVTAAIIGAMIYAGLITLSTRYLFAVTGWLLILVACGMSAQAAGYLSAAGMLPEWLPQLWDSSGVLTQDSLIGRILHAMLGYTERPSGTQLLVYGTTMMTILGFLKLQRRDMAPRTVANAA